MAKLVLGPLLRYVDDSTATIWVETDEPCDVDVLGATNRTFTVHGHHYALVDIDGLAPGTSTPYTVTLDGETVWPPSESAFPQSRIRTIDPADPLRLTLGSCRQDGSQDARGVARLGMDALHAFGRRLAEVDEASWPTLLLLLGDQVYADSAPPGLWEFIAGRRDPEQPPGWEVADFEEYTQLYRLAWREPTVRWVLSTIPSVMIFDDHDVRDDWNISRAWLKRIEEKPWWSRRITAGLGSYWIYQHLGNLSPKNRAEEPFMIALQGGERGADSGDAGPILDDLARRADEERDGRWCFTRDIGRTRLVVLDSRGGRVLDPGSREMLGSRQLAWFDEQARGGVDHLLFATSIPYLLPRGIHYVEAWNEALCDGAWGSRLAARSERLRQTFDLEHWASFQYSFAAVADVVTEVATGRRGEPPASIVFLSGDVHYSYLARARPAGAGSAPIIQVVSSPLRNPLPLKLRVACRIASHRLSGAVAGVLARAAGVAPSPLAWRITRGAWFDNVLATLELDGRSGTVQWRVPYGDAPGSIEGLRELAAAEVTG